MVVTTLKKGRVSGRRITDLHRGVITNLHRGIGATLKKGRVSGGRGECIMNLSLTKSNERHLHHLDILLIQAHSFAPESNERMTPSPVDILLIQVHSFAPFFITLPFSKRENQVMCL
jgi:hypothetical protein